VNARATRLAILNAARRLFVEQGLHGTTTAAVARQARVAVGTLFHHFPSKTVLLEALAADARAHRDAHLGEGVDPRDPVADQLRTVVVGHLRWSIAEPERHRFLELLGATPNVAASPLAAAGGDDVLLGVVERGRREGILRDLPADLLVAIGQRLGATLAAHVSLHPELADDPAFLDQAFAACWGALGRD